LKFNLTEPEEELLSGYEFIHFVAYCKEDSEDIIMCQLRSPYQLNGELFHMIYQNSMLPFEYFIKVKSVLRFTCNTFSIQYM
jgi:hypothetical protein